MVTKQRTSLFEVRMVSPLISWMCFQNSQQQAAGVVGYQQFPFLNQFDTDAAVTIVAFCDAAIHFAQTNVEVHKVTRIITDCISPATRLGLNIFCRSCGIPTLCEHSLGMSFVFDDEHPDNWPTVRDFELKFLSDLQSDLYVLQSLSTPTRLFSRPWP